MQRDWCHKLANVLDKLPKRLRPRAKRALREIMYAPTKADAEKAISVFVSEFEAKYPKATACLVEDQEALLAFFAFPAEHWRHLRTSNLIESPFATVRLVVLAGSPVLLEPWSGCSSTRRTATPA